jgi:hypothetical protein
VLHFFNYFLVMPPVVVFPEGTTSNGKQLSMHFNRAERNGGRKGGERKGGERKGGERKGGERKEEGNEEGGGK